MSELQISVVVPCYNEETNVADALTALSDQQTDYDYEIIVVDSSSDQTPRIVESRFENVRLLHSDARLSCGAARNRGLRMARADKVLFTDADVRVPPNWVQTLGDHLESHDVVGGSLINGTPNSLTGTILFYLEFFRVLSGVKKHESFNFICGANVGYRRAILWDAPFSEDLTTGEDIALNFELSRKRARFFYDSSLGAVHINKQGLKRITDYLVALGKGGHLWRVARDPRGLSLRYPLLMLSKPVLLVLYLYYDRLTNRRPDELLKVMLLTPLLVPLDYFWFWGFWRSCRGAHVGLERDGVSP